MGIVVEPQILRDETRSETRGMLGTTRPPKPGARCIPRKGKPRESFTFLPPHSQTRLLIFLKVVEEKMAPPGSSKSSSLHRRKMLEKRSAREEEAMAASKETAEENDEELLSDDEDEPESRGGGRRRAAGGGGRKIKWKYVGVLVLLFGTAVLPAALWVMDNAFSASNSALSASASAFASRAGLTPTPKARLVKFYEKHNPEKIAEVPSLIHKYAGSYPKMIKVLEAKYHDYGFFIGWKEDADFQKFMKQEAMKYFRKSQVLYKKHMPFRLRVAFYNMYHNLDRLVGTPIRLVYDLVLGTGNKKKTNRRKPTKRTRPSSTRTGK